MKLKTAVADLYRKVSGVPKSELRSQGEMIRQDWKGKPGSDYRTKSAILNAHNLVGNKFRPKGGKATHAALDLAAPLIGSSDVGRAAMTAASLATRGNTPYSEYDRANPFISTKINSIERKYGFAYDNEQSFPVDNNDNPINGDFADLIPVRIGDYQFRGAIGGLTDSTTPTWTGASYAGRPDQIYSYTGVERTISFDLKVYAVSHTQIKDMYNRVNKLYDLVRPTQDAQPNRMSAPFTRLTIGNYIQEQVIMTSLTTTPMEELAWEISNPETSYPSKTLSLLHDHSLGSVLSTAPSALITQNVGILDSPDRYVVPRGLTMNLGFTVLHDAPPTTANAVFKTSNSSRY